MRHQRRAQQWDLFSSQPATPTAEALPLTNQAEAISLLGRLLYEIVRTETQAAETEGGHEPDHR